MIIIDVKESVIIEKNNEAVFDYFTDLRNDKKWRSEIIETTSDNSIIDLDTVFKETSFLSKKVNAYVSNLKCIEYNPHKEACFESVTENHFWAKNKRQVIAKSANKSQVNYHLQFELAIVKHGLGFNLPKFIVSLYTKITMKKYLENLKKILEN